MTTITLPRAVVEQALEALQAYGSHVPNCDHLVLLTSLPPQRKPCSCGLRANITLRAALAQQAEPVQKPPQRKPLTDEEIDAEWRKAASEEGFTTVQFVRNFARAVERAHGIGE